VTLLRKAADVRVVCGHSAVTARDVLARGSGLTRVNVGSGWSATRAAAATARWRDAATPRLGKCEDTGTTQSGRVGMARLLRPGGTGGPSIARHHGEAVNAA
jgi:hypothetical protein